jgi:hypothetical protein
MRTYELYTNTTNRYETKKFCPLLGRGVRRGRGGSNPNTISNIFATFFKKSGTKNCALDKFWDAPQGNLKIKKEK